MQAPHSHESPDSRSACDALVVGGGFYGARLALLLRATGRRVLLAERGPELWAVLRALPRDEALRRALPS